MIGPTWQMTLRKRSHANGYRSTNSAAVGGSYDAYAKEAQSMQSRSSTYVIVASLAQAVSVVQEHHQARAGVRGPLQGHGKAAMAKMKNSVLIVATWQETLRNRIHTDVGRRQCICILRIPT